eukprot:TRINITY_DN5812_c0_g2_i1.p1 TRINITY_DN5812_c0_g2~~TRINITY_DN5812_c0_g2_i1.p1  ORF type:complete len:235 (+),score=22.37 TRINITY_DN5812_c0_g2_i1:287-991(+)
MSQMCEIVWSLAVMESLQVEDVTRLLFKLVHLNEIHKYGMLAEVFLYLQFNKNKDIANKMISELTNNPDLAYLAQKALQCQKTIVKQMRTSTQIQDISQTLHAMGIQNGTRVALAQGYLSADILVQGLGEVRSGTVHKGDSDEKQINVCLMVNDQWRCTINEPIRLLGEWSFKKRLLSLLGWDVIEIYHWEWAELQGEENKQEFLRIRLQLNQRVRITGGEVQQQNEKEIVIGE